MERQAVSTVALCMLALIGAVAAGGCCVTHCGSAVSEPPAALTVVDTPPVAGPNVDDGSFCPPIGLGGSDRCGEAGCGPDPSSGLAALHPYPPSDRAHLLPVPTRPVFGPPIGLDLQLLGPIPKSAAPEQAGR